MQELQPSSLGVSRTTPSTPVFRTSSSGFSHDQTLASPRQTSRVRGGNLQHPGSEKVHLQVDLENSEAVVFSDTRPSRRPWMIFTSQREPHPLSELQVGSMGAFRYPPDCKGADMLEEMRSNNSEARLCTDSVPTRRPDRRTSQAIYCAPSASMHRPRSYHDSIQISPRPAHLSAIYTPPTHTQ